MLKLFLNLHNPQCFSAFPKSNTTNLSPSSRNFRITTHLLLESKGKPVNKTAILQKIQLFLSKKYLKFEEKYNKMLYKIERRFPKVGAVLLSFTAGFKHFWTDFKDYRRIVHQLKTHEDEVKKLESLTLQELVILDQIPRDLARVGPVLFVTSLPIIGYFALPVAYSFPRQLLSSHFWNPQQKVQFELLSMTERFSYNKPLIHYLQRELDKLGGHTLQQELSDILSLTESGLQPEVLQILRCKELFESVPYGLPNLTRKHVKYLSKVHAVKVFKRKFLLRRALILTEMDKAIIRGGGINEVPIIIIKRACLMRGLNPYGMKEEDMRRWLSNWLALSSGLGGGCLSLLLHSSVFLGCNEKSNLQLLRITNK